MCDGGPPAHCCNMAAVSLMSPVDAPMWWCHGDSPGAGGHGDGWIGVDIPPPPPVPAADIGPRPFGVAAHPSIDRACILSTSRCHKKRPLSEGDNANKKSPTAKREKIACQRGSNVKT